MSTQTGLPFRCYVRQHEANSYIHREAGEGVNWIFDEITGLPLRDPKRLDKLTVEQAIKRGLLRRNWRKWQK